ncbi:MAG: adenosylcobinamide-GDP ribazoletransferase [Pseudorhodobacter sp.]|nr:adenosylcobinamide-GDP ribazoletransferase [Pseudorhodobacter sp.]
MILRRDAPSFLLALQFLTRLRMPFEVEFSTTAQAASPRWYALVGVVVGIIAGLVFWAGSALFPPVVAVLLAVAAQLVVTGALHEDGFADACDGLGGVRSRERVLEIMRDSRIGTYGVLGLGMMLAARVAVLAALPPHAVPFVLIAGHAASRASMLWVMASSTYVRGQGAATGVSERLDQRAVVTNLVAAGLAVLPLLLILPMMAVLLGVAGLVGGHFVMRQRFEDRLGGYTGDCLGAVQQCSEIGFYLGILAWLA